MYTYINVVIFVSHTKSSFGIGKTTSKIRYDQQRSHIIVSDGNFIDQYIVRFQIPVNQSNPQIKMIICRFNTTHIPMGYSMSVQVDNTLEQLGKEQNRITMVDLPVLQIPLQ